MALSDFEDWSNLNFELCCDRLLAFMVSCGFWVIVELLHDQGQAFVWREDFVGEELTSASKFEGIV